MLEVKRDGPAARTQLQLAGKQNPNIVERYQVRAVPGREGVQGAAGEGVCATREEGCGDQGYGF